MRTFALTFWSSVLLAATVGIVRGQTNAPVLQITPRFVNELADEMRTNHPALLAARARANAATAGVESVRTWDDPLVKIGGTAAREPMRADEGDLIYGAEQKLPLFGKPARLRQVARAELTVEQANAEAQFQNLRADLAKALFRTALQAQIVAIGEQDRHWLQTAEESADARYRSGGDTFNDVLQIQIERARWETQLDTDRENLKQAGFILNRRLNRPLTNQWPVLDLPPIAGPLVYNDKLERLAIQNEPRLRVMREQIKQARAVAAATRRQRLPDVSVGLEARNYSGDGSFRQGMFVLSMNLPWGNRAKYDSDIRRDAQKVEAAQFDATDYELSLREELRSLTVKVDAARRQALLYRERIIPRSETALESSRANWESGGGTFREMLDSRRMLLDVRLMYVRAVAEQYELLSDLVLCCGLGDLEALQMVGAGPEDAPATQ